MRKNRVLLIIGILGSIAIIILFNLKGADKELDTLKVDSLVEFQPKIEYGIVVDSLIVSKDKVKRNQFLSDILLKYNVDYVDIDIAARRSKPVFDVRRIRVGQPYTAICTNDSIPDLHYFIYEESPTSYVVFDFRDSIHIHRGEKEVRIEMDTIRGVIESSLWNSIIEAEGDPNLANELSEIFAWTIDFFGIKKNDSYHVIYENLYVDDQKIGLGKVKAAKFKHNRKDHYAFYFIQDSIGDYFDENAGSLRRAFLKAPLRFKRISSRFSYSRMHPVLKYRRPHLGVDYAAAVGTPVLSVGDGVVTRIWRTKQGGRSIKIKHNGTYSTAYLHLNGYAKGIKKGVRVKQGQVIAYVGKTGLVTGPHLDFRFYRNGKAIDPLKVKSPAVKPVDSTYLDRYKVFSTHLKATLNDQLYYNF
ncbi:MAG: hypothetical protein CL663_05680 [Bacteroidetes bacterium]|nr:hypothetical protein [Bacteroidota bacterium]